MAKRVKNRDEISKEIEKRHLILTSDGKEIIVDLKDTESLKRMLEDLGDDALLKYVWSEELKNMPKAEPPSIREMQRLELVDYEPAADSGHFRFYPEGDIIYDLLIDWAYDIAIKKFGAMKIETPLIYDWKQSDIREQGESFHERHYSVTAADKNREWVLRFAGDFGLFKMVKDAKFSYKDLPVRIYELSKSFRYEKSGELAGLRRLRGFTMPDVHSFTKGIDEGWQEYMDLYKCYDDLAKGTEISYAIVFRIVDQFYEKHKEKIVEMLKYSGRPAFIELLSGMKHYWAVKHEFQGIDSVGGNCQLSTVQLDVVDAKRYGIVYTDSDGKRKGCVICHSSVGAIERWLFSILENALKKEKPSMPLWLSPTQVRLIPVSDRQVEHCKKLCNSINSSNIRCDIDDRAITMQKKVMESGKRWIPLTAIIGDRELQSGKLSVSIRETGERKELSEGELIRYVLDKTEGKPKKELWLPKLLSKRAVFFG